MDYEQLKNTLLSLKLKDELGLGDLVLIVDSASPKASDGAIKLIKGSQLKPEVTRETFNELIALIDERFKGFQQPKTIIVDNSDLTEKYEALEQRLNSFYDATKDVQRLDKRIDTLPSPPNHTEALEAISKAVESLKTKLDTLPKAKDYGSELSALDKKIQAIPQPETPKTYDNEIAAMQLAFKNALAEIKNDFEIFKVSIDSQLSELGKELKEFVKNNNGQIESLSKQVQGLTDAKTLASRASQQAKAALDRVGRLENGGN